ARGRRAPERRRAAREVVLLGGRGRGLRPSGARPGARVWHRVARVRLADRARPARPRGGGARGARRGELAHRGEPRAGPSQDGGLGGDPHERRDRAVRAAGRRGQRRVQAGAGAGEVSDTRAGYLLLEDGSRFDGDLCGADTTTAGEVVFNTSMSGYQESVT